MKQIGLLAILFTVLLAAVIQKELSRPEAGALRDQVPLVALGPKPFLADDVQSVEISAPGGAETFTIRRDGARWLVEQPFRAPAAAGVVSRLIDDVAAARGELRLTDAAKLASFDLSDERATTIVVRGAGDQVLAHFAVGKTSGQQGAFVRLRYAGADADAAYVVSRDLRGALGLGRTRAGTDEEPEKPLAKHFHDLNLANLALQDATRVDLTTPHWTLAFEKDGPEWSAVDAGPGLPLKPAGVREMIQQLGGSLTATALVDPAKRAELGLDDPAYRVTVTLADGSKRSAVGAADQAAGTFYVRLDVEQDPDVIYETTRYAWGRVFPAGSTLFDFKSLDVPDEGLSRIEVRNGANSFTMTRPEGRPQADWTLTTPSWPLTVKEAQLRNLGAQLRSVRPVDWVDGAPDFTDEIVLRWGAAGAGDDELQTLRIGPAAPAGTGRLAVLPGAPERVVVLTDSTIERVAPDVLTLYEPRPLAGVEADDVTSVVVHAEDGSESYRVTRGDAGAWKLTDADGEKAADALVVNAWIDRLLRLELTKRSEGDAPAATRGITVERQGGEPIAFAIGADGAAVVLGDAAFVGDGEDLVPAAATLLPADDGKAPPDDKEETPGEDDGG